MKLSVLVPVYNECATVAEVLRRVAAVKIPTEIIVVDDGSTDDTGRVLTSLQARGGWRAEGAAGDSCELKLLSHPDNRGKGAAIRTALTAVTGDIVIIQDADLECNPAEYPQLIQPILDGQADVVYGSRFLGSPRRVLFFWHGVGNRLLTFVSNMFTNLNLTDMETCYKVFRTEVLKRLTLRSNRFDIEPELTAKIARQRLRIYEVPISYAGRTYAEGKKIGWKDGVAALWCILRYNLFDDSAPAGEQTLRRVSRLSGYNAWLWEHVAPFVGQRVLEVGAGSGTMTRFLLDREFVLATEIDSASLDRLRTTFEGRSNVVVRALDLNEPLPDWLAEQPPLDTVICLNVLEHIEDDEQVLRRLFSLLAPGGRMVLIVPALPRLYGEIDRAIGHHRRYEKHGIVEKLTRVGFRIEQAKFLNLLGVPGWYLNSCVLRRKVVPGVQARLQDFLVPLLRLEEKLRLPFGMSLFTVGTKRVDGCSAQRVGHYP